MAPTAPDEEREPAPEPLPTLSPRTFAVVAIVVLGTLLALIVALVVVGLARRDIDVTAVVTVLASLFSGLALGGLYKGRTTPGEGRRE